MNIHRHTESNPAFFTFLPLLVVLLLLGCANSLDSPSQSSNGTWTVSGKTTLIGALNPLPGVTVKCGGQSTMSGTDGSYELHGVPEGVQIISAEGPNCKPYSKSIEVRSSTKHFIYLDFNGTTLSGYVSNILDGPIQGAAVRIGMLSDLTDQAGRYEISNVPLKSDSLIVTHTRYYSARAIVSPSGPDSHADFKLQRDTVISGRITADQYVDQAQPYSVFINARLALANNGYIGATYYGSISKHIYINFDFPAFMKDPGVTLLDGTLDLCTDGAYTTIGYDVYAVSSGWFYFSLTYNQQPLVGLPMGSSTGTSATGPRYETVLNAVGLNQLLSNYRSAGLIYGLVIQARTGSVISRNYYSMRSTINQPRVSFKVRF